MREAVDEILLAGLDDWVQAGEVDWAVSGAGSYTKEARLSAAVEVVGELLRDGLMEVGDVTYEGFEPWSLDIEGAMAEIRRRWRALEEDRPNLGDVCWLRLTPVGRERAREIDADLSR